MTRLDDPLDDYLMDKSKAGNSGNYRRNAKRVINEWKEWTHDERSTYTFAALDVGDLEAYARHLKRRTNDSGGLAASSARKYYDYVRAYLSWCQRRPYLDSNPAKTDRAEEPLPDDDQQADHQQQFWTPRQLEAIMSYVERRAHDAIDEQGSDALAEARDRALVATIGYSGVRGGEVLKAPSDNDERRDGVRWRDVDLDSSTMTILEKGKQEYRETGIPGQAVAALDRWQTILDPPSDDWPVFPTSHYGTLYGSFDKETGLRGGLVAAGLSRAEVEDELDSVSGLPAVLGMYREYEIAPPALTTAGARNLMQRLSAAADVPDLDTEDGEYLELHGGRRGAGETLIREDGWVAAAEHLLHDDPKTTKDSYSHLSAEKSADVATKAFENADE